MAVVGAGIRYPVIGASGAAYGFRRIVLPTVITAPGLPTVVGEVPTAVGKRLTEDGVLTAVGKTRTKTGMIPAVTHNPRAGRWARFEALDTEADAVHASALREHATSCAGHRSERATVPNRIAEWDTS
jgi:hypothetical protein